MALASTMILAATVVSPVSAPNTVPPSLVASITAIASAVPSPSGSTVKTQAGDVLGGEVDNIFSFKGIPYATPPVGDLRWREPKPAPIWSGVRTATVYGTACIQTPGLSHANGGDPGPLSEDCLYLNVWTPKLGSSTRLPVMVWIHGGAHIFGAGGPPIYDGTPLAKKGAVIVNFNYRLGRLGFFAHPALRTENPNGPVNFGLLDQIAALQRVPRTRRRGKKPSLPTPKKNPA